MTAKFQCDANGAKMGLSAQVFTVEYLNSAANHLAIVPVKGSSKIFVTVPSADGAKYASEQLTWWDAGGRGTTFSSDFPGPKMSSSCHQVRISVVENPRRPGFVNADIGSTAASVSSEKDI
jgi:membrane-bound inhibitor of C-type lysozyme